MRILITGCSTGIGRAAAVELTKRGHEVIATARKPEVLADLDVAARSRSTSTVTPRSPPRSRPPAQSTCS